MADHYVQEKFKKLLDIQKSLRLPAVIILILFFYTGLSSEEYVFGISKFPLLLFCLISIPAIIFYHFFQWRCPSCNKYLGRIEPRLHKCPYCSTELQKLSDIKDNH